MRVAALTMIYNEPVWARIWVRHYTRQVGAENCLVLDHGTEDGSTDGLGVAVERMRRSSLDEDVRAALVSDCVGELLRKYDAVVHTDADELLIADPARYADLRSYALDASDATTAVGLDLQHLPDEEPVLEPMQSLGSQRQWVRFSAAMCKPAMVRQAVQWSPGFHSCDAARVVGPVYLVHLRYADLKAGLRRLGRTRSQAFARADSNPHQRVADAAFEGMMQAVATLPKVEGDLAIDGSLVSPWLARMTSGWERGDAQLEVSGDALWRLPETFRAAL